LLGIESSMNKTPKILLTANNPLKLPPTCIIEIEKFQAKVTGVGYEYFRACNLAQGFEIACLQQPNLLVVEHAENTSINAMELCRQIKASPLTAAIPILVYSQISNLEDLNSAYMLGASFYLCLQYAHKPNENLSELFDSCLRILDNQAIELRRRTTPQRENLSHPSHGIRLSPVYN
jgi:response regulator RpfG family c-di-GMP phosphodiesterase